ncbi:MAG TPA: uL15 family ribosomal protein [Candidatus Nanoarchaeia archaeon]|nr:uL15 family ribosomal protein [Candidatus Nanoarchaeia archaeon]
MAFAKRRKTTRHRGSHTHGRGGKKKARGSGHRGGFGMAGTGKRGDAKKTMILNLYGGNYFGKSKTLRRGTAPAKAPVMNLEHISSHIDHLVKSGIAKQSASGYEISLPDYKILGQLTEKMKLVIKAKLASAGAIQSVKAAGGEIVLSGQEVVKEVKAEKPAAKAK